VQRLSLTEADLAARQASLQRFSYFFSFISILVFGYTIYMLSRGHFLATFMAIAITAVSLAQAFRYHFWLTQLKQRRLGLSVREWFYIGLLGKSL
jgi:intracellular multiplication protein IcmV